MCWRSESQVSASQSQVNFKLLDWLPPFQSMVGNPLILVIFLQSVTTISVMKRVTFSHLGECSMKFWQHDGHFQNLACKFKSHSLSQWQINGQKFQSLSFQLRESSSLIADSPNPAIDYRSKKSCINWW
jgi:hypothetical protein